VADLAVRVGVFLRVLAALLFTATPLRAQAGLPWQRAESAATFGGHRLQVRAIPWRDFMPSPVRAGGSDLMVNLLLTTADSLPFPTGIRVDSAWVRSGERVWATAPTDEPRPDAPNGLDLMLRGGPRWDTGSPIDILIRLRLPSGERGYLLVRRVPIGRSS
jgi:hypothetical protein